MSTFNDPSLLDPDSVDTGPKKPVRKRKKRKVQRKEQALQKPELKRQSAETMEMDMEFELLPHEQAHIEEQEKKLEDTNKENDPPEGFKGLAKWSEIKWNEVARLTPGTWVSYTRTPTFCPPQTYQEIKAQYDANPDGKTLQAMIDAAWHPRRKKTVCKTVGYDDQAKLIRVESIPLTGKRASEVFPNQTHSWDIPEVWKGDPRFYVIKKDKKR